MRGIATTTAAGGSRGLVATTPMAGSTGGEMETDHAALRRTIVAGVVGNVMEWYDFSVYGYFAVSIGHPFFP